MIKTLKQHQFLFRELVKRDFRQKYKKTTLGVIWSILNPLAEFLVLMLIFKNIFSRNTPHYTIYMLVGIIQKIKVPTWIFPLSKNVSALFNFFITLVLLIPFMIYDHMGFTWKLVFLIYPIVLLFFFNLGVSFILASLYVFFKDVQYFYNIFCRLLYFCCAVFRQKLLHINPVYDFIYYSRTVIIHKQIPTMFDHLILLGYTVLFLVIGLLIYHFNKNKFVYYL